MEPNKEEIGQKWQESSMQGKGVVEEIQNKKEAFRK